MWNKKVRFILLLAVLLLFGFLGLDHCFVQCVEGRLG